VGYAYIEDGIGVVGAVTDGVMTLRAGACLPPDVGRRRGRLRRKVKTFLKSKVAQRLAQVALQIARLYPGTAVAERALRLGIGAVKSVKERRGVDVVETTRAVRDIVRDGRELGDDDDDEDDDQDG
jgi:hypothetical protein